MPSAVQSNRAVDLLAPAKPGERASKSNGAADMFDQMLSDARRKPEARGEDPAPAKVDEVKKSSKLEKPSARKATKSSKADDAEQTEQSAADSAESKESTKPIETSEVENTDSTEPVAETKEAEEAKDPQSSDDADALALLAALAAQIDQTASDDEPTETQPDATCKVAQPIAALPKVADDADDDDVEATDVSPEDATAEQLVKSLNASDDSDTGDASTGDENAESTDEFDGSDATASVHVTTKKQAAVVEAQDIAPTEKPTEHATAKTQPEIEQPMAAIENPSANLPAESTETKSTTPVKEHVAVPTIQNIDANQPQPAQPAAKPQVAMPNLPQPPAAPDFPADNHDQIVTSVRSQALQGGGSMRLRLDPPELGVMQVKVTMVDGAMTASFETSSDQAAKLLSHSLGQLKQSLEAQGVNVEKIHVQQTPRDSQPNSSNDDSQRSLSRDDQQSARQEQQRKDLIKRMWARLGVGDPLDLVA